MKKIFFLFLVSINSFVFAGNIGKVLKGSFTGIINDAATGKPLRGVSVYISDTKSGTSTNANGEYFIGNVPEGIHLIEFSHVGYNTLAEQILIKGETKKDILLSESVVENNAVIVTGVSRASQLKKVPFSVVVMRKEELQQTTSTNIIDAITRKAGVSSLATGPAISKPIIRGLGYNRVLTINDGVRQEGQQWGDEHGIEIDEASVSKIEILKGPASLVYGSDAIAGVINVITNVPVAANTIKTNIGSNYQSNNRLRSLYGNIAGNINGFNWNVYGTIKAAADYKNKYDGNVYNSKFNEQNVGGYVGYNGSWGFSHLLVSSFNLKAGLVEGERDTAGKFIKAIGNGQFAEANSKDFKNTTPQIPYQNIHHCKIATDNNFKIGNNNLTLNVGFQQNKREEFGDIDNPTKQNLFFDLKTITYASQFHIKEKNGWKPSIGVSGMNQTNTNRGIEQLIPNYNHTDFGIFVFTEKDIDKLTISGGLRYDTKNINVKNLLDEAGVTKADAFTKGFNNFSGSAGLAYEVNKNINVKLNIARAFRAPSIPELASNGAHEGTIRYEYGDANLKSEVSTQIDASVELNNKHVSFNLAGYLNNFNNFIFYRKLSSAIGGDSLVDIGGGQFLAAFKFDQRKASLAGIEATLDIHPHPIDWLHFQNTFSYVAGSLKESIEGTKNLPFIPAPKLLTELRGDFKKLGKNVFNSYVKVELDNTFKQSRAFTAFDTETATAGYTLVNAGIGADIKAKDNILFSINFSANNIGNVAYQNHLSRLKYAAENMATGRFGVSNMGRNFSVKVNVPLTFHAKQKRGI